MRDNKKVKLILNLIYFIGSVLLILFAVFAFGSDAYIYLNINQSKIRFFCICCLAGFSGVFFLIFTYLYSDNLKKSVVKVNKLLFAATIVISMVAWFSDIHPVRMECPAGSNKYVIKLGSISQSSYVTVSRMQNIFRSYDLASFHTDNDDLHRLYVKWENDEHFYLKIQSRGPTYDSDNNYQYYFDYYYISGNTSKQISESEYADFSPETGETVYDYYEDLKQPE
ncbi:MAG: hypothetical protein Q4F95_04900 [Oscillospiraceae bacterium]|nr:hypothetical protein [Oscillospiraceae bacterium]